MNTTVKGHQTQWNGDDRKVFSTDVYLEASLHAGVWLVDNEETSQPFLMIVGVRTPEDAARAYAAYRKERGHVPPNTFRVFPLAGLGPIALSGIIDRNRNEEWSAFSNTWVEVRL